MLSAGLEVWEWAKEGGEGWVCLMSHGEGELGPVPNRADGADSQ